MVAGVDRNIFRQTITNSKSANNSRWSWNFPKPRTKFLYQT